MTLNSKRVQLASYKHTYSQDWAITPFEEAVLFYKANYDLVGSWFPKIGNVIFLGDKRNRICRFCGRGYPKVTFRKRAHALPESIGNRSIFTYYECDVCNHQFGKGIENDFGNWSKPIRNLSGIRGKEGVPILRGSSGWRIETDGAAIKVWRDNNDDIVEKDEINKTLTFKLPRDPFVPIAVLKAFVKMALSLMPEAEMPNFAEAVSWITTMTHPRDLSIGGFLPIRHQLIRQVVFEAPVRVAIFRRKHDGLRVPYAFMLLSYANEVFQVFLPCPRKERLIVDKTISLFWWPIPSQTDPAKLEAVDRSLLEFSSRNVVKGEVATYIFHYDNGTTGRRQIVFRQPSL